MTQGRTDGPRHDRDGLLGDLAELLGLGAAGRPDPQRLIDVAAAAVGAAAGAWLTVVRRDGRGETLACSDAVAAKLDAAQTDVNDGPAAETVEHSDLLLVPDLAADGRWPAFGARAQELGVHSLVGARLHLGRGERAVLLFHAPRPHAFDPADVETAVLFGALAGLALRAEAQREHAANLEIALESNRQIGTAMGIVMARELITAEQAFDRLRSASQKLHRKLRAIADEVIETGVLPGATE